MSQLGFVKNLRLGKGYQNSHLRWDQNITIGLTTKKPHIFEPQMSVIPILPFICDVICGVISHVTILDTRNPNLPHDHGRNMWILGNGGPFLQKVHVHLQGLWLQGPIRQGLNICFKNPSWIHELYVWGWVKTYEITWKLPYGEGNYSFNQIF